MATGVEIAPTLFGLQPNVQTNYTIQRKKITNTQAPSTREAPSSKF